MIVLFCLFLKKNHVAKILTLNETITNLISRKIAVWHVHDSIWIINIQTLVCAHVNWFWYR